MKQNSKEQIAINYQDKLWLVLAELNSQAALEVYKSKIQDPEIHEVLDAMYELQSDPDMHEIIRQREKAIRDYYSDMASARSEGKSIERQRIMENMQKNGFSKEQIQLALGEAKSKD